MNPRQAQTDREEGGWLGCQIPGQSCRHLSMYHWYVYFIMLWIIPWNEVRKSRPEAVRIGVKKWMKCSRSGAHILANWIEVMASWLLGLICFSTKTFYDRGSSVRRLLHAFGRDSTKWFPPPSLLESLRGSPPQVKPRSPRVIRLDFAHQDNAKPYSAWWCVRYSIGLSIRYPNQDPSILLTWTKNYYLRFTGEQPD